MPWQLAITISILAITATSLVRRHHSQRSLAPASFPPAISYLFGVAPLGLIAGLLLPHHVQWTRSLVLLLLLIATAAAFSNWFSFRSVKHLPVTRYQLISQSQTIMIIALGWLVLGETLTPHQLIGAGFLLAAAFLAASAPITNHSRASKDSMRTTAIVLALASCLFGAISLIGEKAALGHMDIGAYLIFGYSAQTLGMLILASKDVNRTSLRQLTKNEVSWSAMMGLANGFGGVFYVVALVNSDNISLVTAVTAIGLPLLALGAYVILKEKENQKLLWASLALGVIGLLVGSLR